MDKKSISYRRQVLEIRKGHILQVLLYIGKQLKETGCWNLLTEQEELLSTYHQLLSYFVNGAPDPERQKLYIQLKGRTHLLLDRADLLITDEKERPFYFQSQQNARRAMFLDYQQEMEAYTEEAEMLALVPAGKREKQQRALYARHDQWVDRFFMDVWTQDLWDALQKKQATALLHSRRADTNDLCLLVSAVTLSLRHCFDPAKLHFLCDAYECDNLAVGMRALVGMVLIIHQYEERLTLHPDLETRLTLLNDDPEYANLLCEVEMQFVRTKDTEKVNRKMKEEIIPSMLKNPNLRNKPFISIEDLEEEDSNPDWKEWLDKSGLEKSLLEINELQREGADVYMDSFAQSKTAPFFQALCNWFRPFDVRQEEIQKCLQEKSVGNSSFSKAILRSDLFCDSDKYSFCLFLQQLHKEQRKVLLGQFGEGVQLMEEDNESSNNGQYIHHQKQIAIRQYVQNLYRFFQLHPQREEFGNSLDLFDDITAIPDVFLQSLTNKEHLFKQIELSLKREDYPSAADYICIFEAHYPKEMDAMLHQKIGYCFQKMGEYEGALDNYERADILDPDNYWTAVHSGQCYMKVFDYSKALSAYKKAEALKPDNLSMTFHVAECLIKEDSFKEAIDRLYKLEYHCPDVLKSTRLLAYCLFRTGLYTQAEKYYAKMLEKHASMLNAEDYKNCGYNAWMQGKKTEAFHYWEQSDALNGSSNSCFKSFFDFDKLWLEDMGIPEEELPLIYDAYIEFLLNKNNLQSSL